MKRLYSTQDPLMIAHLKNILEGRGIECVLKNVHLAAAMGELPPIECWPELWVVDERKFDAARGLLKRALAPLASAERPWSCRRCGEEIEGQFGECWSCGAPRAESRRAR